MAQGSSAPEAPWPTAPTEEAWAAMSDDERRRAVERVESMALPDELIEAMAEGDAHLDAKMEVRDTLRAYFGKSGRRIYVGAELSVFYPGRPVFVPDILAVRDVDPHPRNSWFVSAEGKGLDLALEVISRGDSKKDLVGNVARYASLGIEEYFVLDLVHGQLEGHRLQGSRKYRRILPQAGQLASTVLGLELALVEGRLRFYQGTAQLLSAADLATKLERMLDEVVAGQAKERAEREQAEEQLRSGILAILAARRVELSEAQRARVAQTSDAVVLGRWIVRAATITGADELFVDG